MAAKRHAEIAGAGLSGLFTAIALARHGWTVRVHERSPELREIGAGIGLWENGLWALRQIEMLEFMLERCKPDHIRAWKIFDEDGRCLQTEWMVPGLGASEKYTVLRHELLRTLAAGAEREGVDIVTDSEVAGATPEGDLILSDGQRLHADLVVGTDGVSSKVRDSLNLATRIQDLQDGCGRHIVPRIDGEYKGRLEEHWNGARRAGVTPASPDWLYVYLCCPGDDQPGRAQDTTREPWIRTFPVLADVLQRIPDGGRWSTLRDVVVQSWSSGNVALVGDAAHAMAPSLGQGINLAWCNAVALAFALDATAASDLQPALQGWERRERPVSDHTQFTSKGYNWIGINWPKPLAKFRSRFILTLGQSALLQQYINPAVKRRPELGAEAPALAE